MISLVFIIFSGLTLFSDSDDCLANVALAAGHRLILIDFTDAPISSTEESARTLMTREIKNQVMQDLNNYPSVIIAIHSVDGILLHDVDSSSMDFWEILPTVVPASLNSESFSSGISAVYEAIDGEEVLEVDIFSFYGGQKWFDHLLAPVLAGNHQLAPNGDPLCPVYRWLYDSELSKFSKESIVQ